ncbi:MAG: lasso peptide biosynthesis B2 protein [Pseudomonadota bacterium]
MRALTLIRQPGRRQRLVLEAFRELCHAWYLVRFKQFRSFAGDLGNPHPGAFKTTELPEDTEFLRDVRWSIEAINRTVGGRFTCLMQGMAGKSMLNKRDVPNTLILGAKLKREDGDPNDEGMAAHAWLRTGPVIVLGGDAMAGYVPVTSYHSS